MTVLVTGGTSGIGEAVVRRLASEGHQIVFCARREQPGLALETALRSEGRPVKFVVCDVSREDQVESLLARAGELGQPLGAAVNCAGISPRRARLTDSTLEAYEQVFAVNVRGTFLAMKHQMRVLEAQRSGTIVNIASVLGTRALDLGHALYTASKHAVIGLTKTAALEGAPWGVRVNAICPGGIDTPIHSTNSGSEAGRQALTALHPLGRLGLPEEVAGLVSYLLSSEASFMTGAVLSLDGGAGI